MHRRSFVTTALRSGYASVLATTARVSLPGAALLACRSGYTEAPAGARAQAIDPLDPPAFHRTRLYVDTRFGRVAYVERGAGPGALFLHGFPLNGYQWRGALERLAPYRRCLAPDFLGLGYTEAAPDQDVAPATQAAMLLEFLDGLGVHAVDVVANDSGLTVAQLLAVRAPGRVRSLLLTNGDVEANSPPPALAPILAQARDGVLADRFLVPQLAEPELARAPQGLGGLAYTWPASLTDESVRCYFAPLVATPARKLLFHRYALAFEPNPLPAITAALRRCPIPARMVWGTGDPLFPIHWADWLDRTLPNSRGVRRVEGANLFFPEEMPELIAEEARRLWQAD